VSERGVTVALSDGARDLLGELGYDPAYGARPLKRVIQKQLVDPLARGLLAGTYAAGDQVSVEAADGALQFTVARPGEVEAEPAVA
jgi:ATP-dependent Clp protease ATP-binding subunit ClpB